MTMSVLHVITDTRFFSSFPAGSKPMEEDQEITVDDAVEAGPETANDGMCVLLQGGCLERGSSQRCRFHR